MFDAYAMVTTALAAHIADVYPEGGPLCDSALCEVSTPLPIRLGLPAEACRQALMAGPCLRCLDVPLLRDVSVSGGYLCFHLSSDFYRVAVQRVVASAPLPELPPRLSSRQALAFARARMYAAKPGLVPDDPRLHKALWSCFALSASRPGRQKRAAEDVLALWRIPLRERDALLAASGAAMAAMARLLYFFGEDVQ